MQGNIWIKWMNALVALLIILVALALFTLPYLVHQYIQLTGSQPANPIRLTVFLYLTAIPFLILLVMAKKLCNNALNNNPFCQSSISAFYVISICAFVDFVLYFIGTLVFLRNLLSLTLMVAAFMVGLISLNLSQLVKVAMEIKEENDLTI
jgi:hypothetical protein